MISESRELSKEELGDLDEDDFGGDDDDFQFGFHTVANAKPKKQLVSVVHQGQTFQILTNAFVWAYPWLQIKITSNRYNNLKSLLEKGYFTVIEYGLDDRPSVSPISLFMTSLEQNLLEHDKEERKKEENESKKNHSPSKRGPKNGITPHDRRVFDLSFYPFIDFIKQKFSSNPGSVRLSNLFDLLSEYENLPSTTKEEWEDRILGAKSIRQMIDSTEAGGILEIGINCSEFFKLGPLLFPRKIGSIIRHTGDDPGDRQSKSQLHSILNQMLQTNPWKVGFSEIIYQETKKTKRRWSGLEASLKSMKSSEFYTDQLERIHQDALHIYDLIKELCRKDGHTFVTEDDISRNYKYYDRIKYDHTIASLRDTLSFLVKEKVLHKDKNNLKERFHLMRYWRAEEKIVKSLKSLIRAKHPPIEINMEGDEFTRVRKDAKQLLAAKKICHNPVTVISGRGGTGKTEVVTTVLNGLDKYFVEKQRDDLLARFGDKSELHESEDAKETKGKSKSKSSESKVTDNKSSVFEDVLNCSSRSTLSINESEKDQKSNGFILYTAPTGKAAAVMRKRSGRKAFTMHQILASFKAHLHSQGESDWKFSETKILAVDESSMVSIELFSSLISCLLDNTQLMKVVLLGDVLQLPSIDPGNFMCDLFFSLRAADSVVELTTNHRSEGSLIFKNAERISQQKDPIFNKVEGFHLLTDQPVESLPLYVRSGAENLSKVTRPSDLIELHKKVKGQQMPKDKEDLYLSLLRQRIRDFDLVDSKKSQFIAFRRAECNVVNEFCCEVYNNHKMFGPPDKFRSNSQYSTESTKMVLQFLVGDKIMCSKNSDVQVFCEAEDDLESDPEKSKEPEEKRPRLVAKNDRLMNGNVYIIEKVVQHSSMEDQDQTRDESTKPSKPMKLQKYYELDDLTGEIIRPNSDQFRKFCKPAHAWALTIHKFQGSEADTVVYGVSDSKNENWQHVYTAVTRGKKKVIIVGTWDNLRDAVRRKPRPRQTALAEKVQKFLLGKDDEVPENASNDLFCDDPDFEQCMSQMSDTDFNAGHKSDRNWTTLVSKEEQGPSGHTAQPAIDDYFKKHVCRKLDLDSFKNLNKSLFPSEDSFDQKMSQMNDSDYGIFTQQVNDEPLNEINAISDCDDNEDGDDDEDDVFDPFTQGIGTEPIPRTTHQSERVESETRKVEENFFEDSLGISSSQLDELDQNLTNDEEDCNNVKTSLNLFDESFDFAASQTVENIQRQSLSQTFETQLLHEDQTNHRNSQMIESDDSFEDKFNEFNSSDETQSSGATGTPSKVLKMSSSTPKTPALSSTLASKMNLFKK